MEEIINKMKKSADIVELRSLETLDLNVPYQILRMVWVNTKFGPSVQVYLQEVKTEPGAEDETFRVYLPKRISSNLSEEDVYRYNNMEYKAILLYTGKKGNTFCVDFA